MRKTNLFPKEDKTNFLTFSNYGEYLTGVCLSTNHKIWPSSFLCLNLPFSKQISNLNIYNDGIGTFDNIDNTYEYTLDEFKHFLMCYYENKLAWLRDDYDSKDKKQEDLKPLSYLLEAISKFFNIKLNEIDITTNEPLYIKYFGDIVEHDYNGSYNDSICIVDFNRIQSFNIKYLSNFNYDKYKSNYPLHNWYNELSDEYFGIFDSFNINNPYKDYVSITYETYCDESIINKDTNHISFNCIIPLFKIINQNIGENNDSINEEENDVLDKYSAIPYGIWFTSENSDGTLNNIDLYKQNDNIAQSWSLVICSKFAPYPYGVKIDDDNVKDIEKYTYVELLSKQSELLNNYNEALNKIESLSTKVNTLNKRIKDIEQLYPENGINIMDQVNESLRNSESYVHSEINSLKNIFMEYMEQLKWKAINTSDKN